VLPDTVSLFLFVFKKMFLTFEFFCIPRNAGMQTGISRILL